LRGRLTGSAREEEEGIRAGCRGHRWQHDNPQIYLPSNPGMAILGDRDRPAECVGRAFIALTGPEAV
jgi:hypothetical protein